MNTKYWTDYNEDTSIQGSPAEFSTKSKDFEYTFIKAVYEWNEEVEGPENMVKENQIKPIRTIAEEFFKIEKWISINVVHAIIMQTA